MEMVRQQLLLKVLNKYEENILKGEFVFLRGMFEKSTSELKYAH